MNRPKTVLTCAECENEIDETEVNTIINIEENERGWDVVYYVCPFCGSDTSSLRKTS